MLASLLQATLASHQELWFGDCTLPSVEVGNRIAVCIAPMLVVMHHIGVRWILEQPISSLWAYADFTMKIHGRFNVQRITTYLGAFGSPSVKVFSLGPSKFKFGAVRSGAPVLQLSGFGG